MSLLIFAAHKQEIPLFLQDRGLSRASELSSSFPSYLSSFYTFEGGYLFLTGSHPLWCLSKTAALLTLLDQYHLLKGIKHIVNVGTCGSLDETLYPLGMVCGIEKVFYSEEECLDLDGGVVSCKTVAIPCTRENCQNREAFVVDQELWGEAFAVKLFKRSLLSFKFVSDSPFIVQKEELSFKKFDFKLYHEKMKQALSSFV